MSDGTAELPQELRDALQRAYLAYHQANQRSEAPRDRNTKAKERAAAGKKLAALAVAGRRAGWPVRAMAEPCGDITPERLRQIIRDWAPSRMPPGTPKFPKYERPRPAKTEAPKTKVKRSSLTEDEVAQLHRLAVDARQNTGSRPLGSKYRKASEQFSKMIIRLHKRGVIWQDLSDASGLTVSGLRMRAARHGYGSGPPPSIQPYRRVELHPTKKTVKSASQKQNETSTKKKKSA